MTNKCIWEDCDQAAVYCPSHALEYANVESVSEAIHLRHENGYLAERLAEVVVALKEVIRISDRKHEAWDAAKAAIERADRAAVSASPEQPT